MRQHKRKTIMDESESELKNLSSRAKELKEQRLSREDLKLERKELHSEVANMGLMVNYSA